MWVGEEDGNEDEQAKQWIIHKSWLADSSEKGVDTVAEGPCGGAKGSVGEVAGDDRAVAQEGGPRVGLGMVRHDATGVKERQLRCQ